MIHFINVAKSYGNKVLFKNVNFHISPSSKIGLVGRNGSGKSTFFQLILGNTEPDEGEISVRKGLKIGYLKQEVHTTKTITLIEDVINSVKHVKKLFEEKENILNNLDFSSSSSEASLKHEVFRHGEIEDQLITHEGYKIPSKAKEILIGLGFKKSDFYKPLNSFSGGFLIRCELAKILLNEPELLLLDEPTNHLDIPSMNFLENYLKSFNGAYVIITHDREFLNKTAEIIIELTPEGVKKYPGNYEKYVELKEQEYEVALKKYEAQQARIREIKEFIARNRVRKDRAQLVQSRIRMLEKMEVLPKPISRRRFDFELPEPPDANTTIVELKGVSKSFGSNQVLKNINFTMLKGEKVAIIGENGSGKTTLLKIIAKVLKPDTGSVMLGSKVKMEYFSQHLLEELNPENTIVKEMEFHASVKTYPYIKTVLGMFGFSGDDIEKRIKILSGGEKTRVALARLFLKETNFLLFDEPTNHLDMETREILEKALKKYSGSVIFISHDRAFIDAVATKTVVVKNGGITEYNGNYSYYLWKTKESTSNSTLQADKGRRKPKKGVNKKQQKEKKRKEAQLRQELYRQKKPLLEIIEGLEENIMKLENEIKEIDEMISSPDFYKKNPNPQRVLQKHSNLKKLLEKYYADWESVSVKLDRLESDFQKKLKEI